MGAGAAFVGEATDETERGGVWGSRARKARQGPWCGAVCPAPHRGRSLRAGHGRFVGISPGPAQGLLPTRRLL